MTDIIQIDPPEKSDPAAPAVKHAASTNRAYQADVAHFEAFCAANNLGGPLPAEPAVIAQYLASIARTHATTTLMRRVYAIVQAHRAAGLDLASDHALIRQTIAQIAQAQTAPPPRRAAALGLSEVRAMIATCPADDLTGTRDRAMLLIGFAGGLRRSEIVGIDREHLTFQKPGGILLFVPRDDDGEEVVIPYGRRGETCPVCAMQNWLDASETQRGPVFRGIDRWGAISLTRLIPDGVRRIVRRAAERAGLDVGAHEGVSPHGLRAGCVTEAYKAGARASDIMAHTRHKSSSTLRLYIRRSNNKSDHPARLLGL